MPGIPGKGEGMIRSYDLIEMLQSDIDAAYETLESNKQSQYLRRCVVRAVFSYVEAMVECVKVELRSTIRRGYFKGTLTTKEQETLGSIDVFGARLEKFMPLEQNIKRTFKLAAKVWGLDFRLATGGEEFRDFIAAKSARNQLTHPRRLYDIEVTDRDMHCHTIAFLWMQREFRRLFTARVESLAGELPEELRRASPKDQEFH